MGPLTYKVFNLHHFRQCGTFHSHLPQQLSYKFAQKFLLSICGFIFICYLTTIFIYNIK
jgi:hypothetical protein